jgi:hypothetical protein
MTLEISREAGAAVRIKTEKQEAGPVPSERVVTIRTFTGPEDVIVHSSQVDAKGVEVGFIGQKGDEFSWSFHAKP